MGHQVVFHMLEADRIQFFSFLSSRYELGAAHWTGSAEIVDLSSNPAKEHTLLALWRVDQQIQPSRKRIERNDKSVVYEFDRGDHILEFDPGRIVDREGRVALLQGRLYSFAGKSDPQLDAVFKSADSWLRRTFRRCSLELLGGFVGPAAAEWYERENGIFLPTFNPPSTAAWEHFIKSQHRTILH
jgi:hypothetical protein